MYPRTYEFVQPSSYSYTPQNFPGTLHYSYGYSQPRYTNYSAAPIQPQVHSGLQRPPPPLTHLTEQLSGNHRSHTEERPSCMLQEAWRPVFFRCSRNEREHYDQENDAESVEDRITGNFLDWFGFLAKLPAVYHVIRHNLLTRKHRLIFAFLENSIVLIHCNFRSLRWIYI